MKRPSTTGDASFSIKRQKLDDQSSVPSFNSLLESFNYVCRIFPSEAFSPPIPPFVLKNQLYALSGSRTRTDKELNELLSTGTLRTLRLFDDEFSVVVMHTSDYERSLFSYETVSSKELISRFLEYVRKACPSLTVTHDSVRGYFTDKDIRSPYSWWLSCPQLGRFISSYKTGLRKFKEVFLRARLKELLLSDLLRRNWKKKSSLGPLYILLDQLGSGAITKYLELTFMSGAPASLQRDIRFPWTVRRSENTEGARPEDTSCLSTHADLVVTSAISQDTTPCQPTQPTTTELEEAAAAEEEEAMMMSPDKLVPPATPAEDQPPEPPSNEDLDELANSLLAMQQFVEDLQLEVLKHRQEAEHDTRKEWQPRPEYADLLNGLEKISGVLETHKTDYSVVTETQAENVQLRQRLIALTAELAEVRAEFKKAKADFEREMVLLREETKVALEEQKKRLYDEREQQMKAFDAERAKWHEERAELLIEQAKSMACHLESKDRDSTINSDFQQEIYRQITEVQNQANARVAQLQTQIDLLTARPPSSTATVSALKRSLPGARPMTPRNTATNVAPTEPPRWPAPITPRPTLLRPTFGTPRTAPPKCTGPVGAASVSNVPPTASNRPLGGGGGRGGGGFKARGQTPATVGASVPVSSAAAIYPRSVPSNLPRRTAPVAPIAAVPPVLVVSSSVSHPLLNSTDISDESEGQTDAAAVAMVKLPNSTWRKASELEGGNCTSSDYFQLPGSEQYDGGKSVTFSSPGIWLPYDDELTPTEPPEFDAIGLTQLTSDPHLPESPVETPPRKRHLFSMQSGDM